MNFEVNEFLGAIVIGIGATLVMDLWNLFLKRAFSIPSLNYCFGFSTCRMAGLCIQISMPRHRKHLSVKSA